MLHEHKYKYKYKQKHAHAHATWYRCTLLRYRMTQFTETRKYKVVSFLLCVFFLFKLMVIRWTEGEAVQFDTCQNDLIACITCLRTSTHTHLHLRIHTGVIHPNERQVEQSVIYSNQYIWYYFAVQRYNIERRGKIYVVWIELESRSLTHSIRRRMQT